MTLKEFNISIRAENIKYRDLFGYIPCIADFSCSREQYIEAIKQANAEKVELHLLLNAYHNEKDFTTKNEI